MKTITVGPIVGRLGEKVSGFLDVPAAADPGTRIPYPSSPARRTAGAGAGRRDARLGAGADRRAPARARRAQSAELSGTVILVQVANLPSFVHRTVYRGPWDQKNLNRVFPGHPHGTASERIAYAITTNVIDQCDALVDMHSGDANEALRPYSYWNKLGVDDAVDDRARDLALAFGLDHIVVDRGRPRDRGASIFCANTAQVRGKPALTTEAGEVGVRHRRCGRQRARSVPRHAASRHASRRAADGATDPNGSSSRRCWRAPAAAPWHPW
jgi:hypothetical protein